MWDDYDEAELSQKLMDHSTINYRATSLTYILFLLNGYFNASNWKWFHWPSQFFFFIPSDVCNNTDLPELEIISLLEEQLPVYRLRADTIFGYEQDDWLHTPLTTPDTALPLTTEQIEETLKYFCKWLYVLNTCALYKFKLLGLNRCYLLNLPSWKPKPALDAGLI